MRPADVWIDTDPALGEPDRDVDDAFALIQAFRTESLHVRGVSAVFGNTSLDRTFPIATTLVRRFGRDPKPPVFAGAAAASDLGLETKASRAIAAALRSYRLRIIALGPLTNIATALLHHPELAVQVEFIVAVAGRRPGQRLTTGTANPRGHRDLNFELDPDAFRHVLDSGVPIVLTPFELASQVWIDAADLDRLRGGGDAGRLLEPPARRWLSLWTEAFGVTAFNPFDTLAVGYAAAPHAFEWESLCAQVEAGPDDVTEARMQGCIARSKLFLHVSKCGAAPGVRYCTTPPAAFKNELLYRLCANTKGTKVTMDTRAF